MYLNKLGMSGDIYKYISGKVFNININPHINISHNFLVAQNYSYLFKETEKLEFSPVLNIWGDVSVGY
jgi:hypothetical protein